MNSIKPPSNVNVFWRYFYWHTFLRLFSVCVCRRDFIFSRLLMLVSLWHSIIFVSIIHSCIIILLCSFSLDVPALYIYIYMYVLAIFIGYLLHNKQLVYRLNCAVLLNVERMAKRKQLSGNNCPPHARRRFNFDIPDEDFEEFTRGYVPQNTMGDTQKCVRLFTEWRSERNSHFPDDLVP